MSCIVALVCAVRAHFSHGTGTRYTPSGFSDLIGTKAAASVGVSFPINKRKKNASLFLIREFA